MKKAIIYKEWIKLRRLFPLAVLVTAGFTAYVLMRIGHMYAFNGAGSVWMAVLEQNAVLIDDIKYLPAIVGLLVGIVQFVPEVQHKRLKLTLHLPYPQRGMILLMLGFGIVLTTGLFVLQAAATWAYLESILAHELAARIMMTAMPWYAAGTAAYLLTAWICIEPTWRLRMFDILVAAGTLRLFFLSGTPRGCDTLLPWIAAVIVCALFFSLYSTDRFMRGCQD
jgi:hypothetical protein